MLFNLKKESPNLFIYFLFFNVCFTYFYYEKGEDGRDLKLAGNVGFVSLPDQLVNKRVNRGFYFNILCVGE